MFVPFKIPIASTLAGLVGCVQEFVLKGSVGGALDARGGIFIEPPPLIWLAGTAIS